MPIKHDIENQRFILEVSGKEAIVDYRMRSGVMHLIYSEVPAELRGKGIGRKLVEATFDKLTEDGFKAVADCRFIRSVARRSEKWNSVIE